MAEAASTSRLAAHVRVELARVLRRPATRTPQRRCTGALSSGRRCRGRAKFASCSSSCSLAAPGGGAAGPGAAGGSPRGRRRGRRPANPRRYDSRSATAPRPTRCKGRLWRPDRRAEAGSPDGAGGGVRSSSGRGFSTGRHAGSAAAAARAAAGERRIPAGGGPAARRMLGVPWQSAPATAAALASLARKRRRAELRRR
jgi:hypothetical protein